MSPCRAVGSVLICLLALALGVHGWASTLTTTVSWPSGLRPISLPLLSWSNTRGCGGRGDSSTKTLFPTTVSGSDSNAESRASAAWWAEVGAIGCIDTDNPVPLQLSITKGFTDQLACSRMYFSNIATLVVSLSTEYRLNEELQNLISAFWPEKGFNCAISRSRRSPYKRCDLGPCSMSCFNRAAASFSRFAAALLKQLIEQGPRSHLLYGERRERLIAQLKPFSGQKAEIRFCNSSFNLYSVDNDTTSVAMLLKYILEQANWSVNPLVIDNCSGTGLSVSIHTIAPTSAHQAADALLSALLSLPLTVVGLS